MSLFPDHGSQPSSAHLRGYQTASTKPTLTVTQLCLCFCVCFPGSAFPQPAPPSLLLPSDSSQGAPPTCLTPAPSPACAEAQLVPERHPQGRLKVHPSPPLLPTGLSQLLAPPPEPASESATYLRGEPHKDRKAATGPFPTRHQLRAGVSAQPQPLQS